MLCIPFTALTAGAATSYIDRINVTIDVPVDGIALKTNAVIDEYCDYLGAKYSKSYPASETIGVSWYLKGSATPLKNGYKAKLGETYTLTVVLTAKEGYAFRDDMASYNNRINDKAATEVGYASGSTVYWSFSVDYATIPAVSGNPIISIKNMQLSPYEGEPMEVEISATGTNVKYQWQICYGDYDGGGGINWGSAVEINDNERYQGCQTPKFKIHTYFGDTFDEDLSFCKIRCEVTSDSGTSYSQEFWYVLVDRIVVNSISVNGVVAPVSGNLISKTANESAAEYSVSDVEWYYSDSNGAMTKMDDNEVFVYGDYVCRIHITPEREYKFDSNTKIKVNGVSRELTIVSGADSNPFGADRYYVDVPYTIDEVSDDIIDFKVLSPTPNATDRADCYSELGAIEYGKSTVFGFVPKALPAEMINDGYTIAERVYLNRTGMGTLLTRQTGAQFDAMAYIDAFGDYQVWCQILLYKDGEFLTGKTHIYDFSVVPCEIDYVSATVTTPYAGMAPDKYGAAGGEGYIVTDVDWSYYNEKDGEFYLMPDGMTFEAGKRYECAVQFETLDGYIFPENRADFGGKLNGVEGYIPTVYYTTKAYVTVEFIPEVNPNINPDWGKTEEDIIKSVEYVLNSDGTYNAHVSVDLSNVDPQMLQHSWEGTGYYWYDHNNNLHAGAIGGLGLDDLQFTIKNLATNLEAGKSWRVKVYLSEDYYADYEWQGYSFSFVTFTVPEAESSYTLGDVNADGAIDQFDYILVKRHYFGTRYLTETEMLPADANCDGTVDQFDYILIKRHYFGTFVIGG